MEVKTETIRKIINISNITSISYILYQLWHLLLYWFSLTFYHYVSFNFLLLLDINIYTFPLLQLPHQ